MYWSRQSTGHLVGEHGLEHESPVACEGSFDRQLLRVHDPSQALGRGTDSTLDPITRCDSCCIRHTHALEHGPVIEADDLAGIRDVHREVSLIAGDDRVEKGGDEFPEPHDGSSFDARSAARSASSVSLSARCPSMP